MTDEQLKDLFERLKSVRNEIGDYDQINGFFGHMYRVDIDKVMQAFEYELMIRRRDTKRIADKQKLDREWRT